MEEWEDQYETLLFDALKDGSVRALDLAHEHREKPRFPVEGAAIWIRTEVRFQVLDVSTDGVSFLSERSFTAGQRVALTLGKAFLVEAEVVECRMIETDADLLENKYRVACTFSDGYNGTRVLVMLKEMEEDARENGRNATKG